MAGTIPHGTGVGIEADVSKAFVKLDLVSRVFSLRELLLAIGQGQLEWVGANLRAAGTETAWKEMAASTRRVRPLRQSPRHFSSNYQRELQQSFNAPRIDENRGEVTIGTALRFAWYHHHGTRPYTIRPKRGGRLVFRVGDGSTVFAREVRHPGLPARPFLPQSHTAKRLAVTMLQAMERRLAEQMPRG